MSAPDVAVAVGLTIAVDGAIGMCRFPDAPFLASSDLRQVAAGTHAQRFLAEKVSFRRRSGRFVLLLHQQPVLFRGMCLGMAPHKYPAAMELLAIELEFQLA